MMGNNRAESVRAARYQIKQSYRRTGRTTKMVESARDGDTIVVHSHQMISYIKRLPAAQGKVLRFAVVQDHRDDCKLRGIDPDRILWDHYAAECYGQTAHE